MREGVGKLLQVLTVAWRAPGRSLAAQVSFFWQELAYPFGSGSPLFLQSAGRGAPAVHRLLRGLSHVAAGEFGQLGMAAFQTLSLSAWTSYFWKARFSGKQTGCCLATPLGT